MADKASKRPNFTLDEIWERETEFTAMAGSATCAVPPTVQSISEHEVRPERMGYTRNIFLSPKRPYGTVKVMSITVGSNEAPKSSLERWALEQARVLTPEEIKAIGICDKVNKFRPPLSQ